MTNTNIKFMKECKTLCQHWKHGPARDRDRHSSTARMNDVTAPNTSHWSPILRHIMTLYCWPFLVGGNL